MSNTDELCKVLASGLTHEDIIMADARAKGYVEGFKDGIQSAPSIEIVRCSECKHRFDCFSQVAMTNKYQTTTLYQDIDFCSYGERSE